jgi:hypothetical protein
MTPQEITAAAKGRGYAAADRAFADRTRERPGRRTPERWTVVDRTFTPIASATVARNGRITFRPLGGR